MVVVVVVVVRLGRGVLPGDSAATAGGSEGMQSRCLVQPPRIELGNGTTTVPQGGTDSLKTA